MCRRRIWALMLPNIYFMIPLGGGSGLMIDTFLDESIMVRGIYHGAGIEAVL